MKAAPLPENEPERLAKLREYGILDTLPEPEYDDITYLASQICAAPIAMISLVDRERQWFKAKVGVEVSETPRDVAFCAHAILEPDDLLVVPDALQDTRFADNPLVTAEPHIRFYAGAPLVTAGGASLGTLCVIDRVPRQLTDAQRRSLGALARQVMAVLELRAALARQARSEEERTQYQVRLETYQRELEATNAQLAVQAVTDNLTGLMNRRAFERVLETEIERALRYTAPLSLALVDIDHFKAYNDTFGHLGGDEVLKRVAGLLARNSRSSDAVARIGGEEFAIILPSTPAANAYVQAQRFREAVERAHWAPRPMTVSVGLCTHTETIRTRSDFMRLADRALYASKESGRNRVSASPPAA